jgi:hypothetical protein
MSTRVILLEQISNLLGESIDIDKVNAVPLKLNNRTTFTYGEYEYGMLIQNIGEGNKHIFPNSFTLPPRMEGYYNFGFDLEGKTTVQEPKSYKELAKPLSIVAKSLFVWIQQNNPSMITIFADSDNAEEKTKKINIYGSILYRERNTLNNMGYTWDFFNSPVFGKSIYIKKQINI